MLFKFSISLTLLLEHFVIFCFFLKKELFLLIKSHCEGIFIIVTKVITAFSSMVFQNSNCIFIDSVFPYSLSSINAMLNPEIMGF